MSVTLREKTNLSGSTSQYLEIYENGERRYEFLPHLKIKKAANPADRQDNKEKRELAKKIALARAVELSANDYSTISGSGKKTDVVKWMQSFVDKYKKKDKRNMQGALNHFKDFLVEDSKQGLTFGRLTELIISDYQDYLRDKFTGEGPSSYFNRFKKMVRQAYRQKLTPSNVAAEVKTVQGTPKKKDTLTLQEIQILANTPMESPEVRRASLFALSTGLRWIDVKQLTWESINRQARTLTVKQSKTNKEVSAPLNDTALALLGYKPKDTSLLVFKLPSANGANKTLKAWVKRAGIEKKVTFHNFRHSYGTNLIYHGADVTTASNLLGHSSLKHTMRYVKAANDLKERATDKLNFAI